MMNTKSLLPLAFLTALTGSALATSNTGCDQQAIKCTSARDDYYVRYTYVSGPESCRELVAETVGMQTYSAVGEFGKPDLDRQSIAMQPEGIGNLAANAAAGGVTDPDPNDKEYSFGPFNSAEPVGDICTVPTLSIAQQQLAAVAADEENEVTEQPATLINYAWSNVRFYVTPQYAGSQFQANVTVGTNGTDCVYTALGLAPTVSCDDGEGNPDENACKPEATLPDPNNPKVIPHPTGSGINPDIPVRCDPVLLHCVPISTGFPFFR